MLIVSAISIWSYYLQYDLVNNTLAGNFPSRLEIASNDARVNIIGWISAGIFILTSIIFLSWFYRMHKNLYRANAPYTKYKSGWAIGGFFIPILNFLSAGTGYGGRLAGIGYYCQSTAKN